MLALIALVRAVVYRFDMYELLFANRGTASSGPVTPISRPGFPPTDC